MTPSRARPRLPFDRLLLPIAEEDDAEATCAAVRPSLEGADDDVEVVVVHVIEKTEGYPDKAPLEARREQGDRIFAVVRDRLSDVAAALETDLRYGHDVVEEVFAAAEEADATVVGFTPRGGNRWVKLLSGDRARKLTSESELPVVVFPRPDEPALESDERATIDTDPIDGVGDGERILVPIDGSDASLRAVEYACSNYPDAEVTVLHVLESPGGDVYGGMTGGRSTEVEDQERRRDDAVDRLFDEARRAAADHDATLSTLTLTGDVANAVLTCAEELEAATIVVGRRGREGGGGLANRFLGGVSESIVERSTVPVTVVR